MSFGDSVSAGFHRVQDAYYSAFEQVEDKADKRCYPGGLSVSSRDPQQRTQDLREQGHTPFIRFNPQPLTGVAPPLPLRTPESSEDIDYAVTPSAGAGQATK